MKRTLRRLALFIALACGLVAASPDAHAFAQAVRVLPGTYQPTWVAGGCSVWLRSDLGITTATGVSVWLDQSGGAHGVAQATGANQPTYTTSDSAYNNHPSLGFLTATDQYMVSGASLQLSQPYTVVIVGQASVGTKALWESAAVVEVLALPAIEIYAGATLASSTSLASPNISASVFNGTSSLIYVNSSASSVASGSAGAVALSGVYSIGGQIAGALPLTGKIAEFLICNVALSTAQLHTIFVYAASRYGTSWSILDTPAANDNGAELAEKAA